MGVAIGVLVPTWRLPQEVDTVSAVHFGLIVGLLLTYAASLVLTPLPFQPNVRNAVQMVLGIVLCYLCISILMQTRVTSAL